MLMPPEKRRKPDAATSDSPDAKALHGAFEREDTPEAVHLQALRIRQRFGLSWPLPVHVAELAFPAGRAA